MNGGTMDTKKKYSITPEDRIELAKWRDAWIANARRTDSMTVIDRHLSEQAIRGIYDVIQRPQPERVVFVASPLTLRIASGIASGIRYLREHPRVQASIFGRQLSEEQLLSGITPACRLLALLVRQRLATLEVPRVRRGTSTCAAADADAVAAAAAAADAADADA